MLQRAVNEIARKIVSKQVKNYLDRVINSERYPEFLNFSDKDFFTFEIFRPNDFYYHSYHIKIFSGMPTFLPIKAILQHGVFFGNYYWDHELRFFDSALVWGANYKKNLLSAGKKHVYEIGAPYFYCEEHVPAREIVVPEKFLLVFPSHSTHTYICNYDVFKFCDYIDALKENFNSVVVCLYWKDFQNLDLVSHYKTRGYMCTTAGHMYDMNFLPRLKYLIRKADSITSNKIGSYLGYAVHEEKPFSLFNDPIEFSNCTELEKELRLIEEDKKYLQIKSFFDSERGFSKANEAIFSVMDDYWGFTQMKSKTQLKQILLELEEKFYQR
jgi:hypothetical protein